MKKTLSFTLLVAGLAAGLAVVLLALGTIAPSVPGDSPYTSALADLSVASASADPPNCAHKECKFNKFEIWVCIDTTHNRACVTDGDVCTDGPC